MLLIYDFQWIRLYRKKCCLKWRMQSSREMSSHKKSYLLFQAVVCSLVSWMSFNGKGYELSTTRDFKLIFNLKVDGYA